MLPRDESQKQHAGGVKESRHKGTAGCMYDSRRSRRGVTEAGRGAQGRGDRLSGAHGHPGLEETLPSSQWWRHRVTYMCQNPPMVPPGYMNVIVQTPDLDRQD